VVTIFLRINVYESHVMPESDPVKRMKAAARRGVGTGTVEEQRGWYFEELERDIGRDPSGTWQSAAPSESGGFVALLIALLFVSAIAFATTMAVMLWKDGRLNAYLPQKSAAAQENARWVIEAPAAEADGQIEDPMPNEIEAALNPKPSPPADDISEADVEAAE
jgi:hypothetical protein